MSKENIHIDLPEELQNEMSDFFSRATIPYKRAKEDVLETIWASTNIQQQDDAKIIRMRWIRLAVASIILLLGVSLFMRFYFVNVVVPNGQHMAMYFPDGSRVELNAGSELKYQPYWWRFSRNVKFFNGEGYFDVKKGSTFKVISAQGITEVLGTSFNIYARNNDYQVTCITGNVQVTSGTTYKKVKLEPNTKAIISSGKEITKSKVKLMDEIISWRNRKFVFTASPLHQIFSEVERQYNINIIFNENTMIRHTVSFTTEMNQETVLNMICKPNRLQYSTIDEKNYTITSVR